MKIQHKSRFFVHCSSLHLPIHGYQMKFFWETFIVICFSSTNKDCSILTLLRWERSSSCPIFVVGYSLRKGLFWLPRLLCSTAPAWLYVAWTIISFREIETKVLTLTEGCHLWMDPGDSEVESVHNGLRFRFRESHFLKIGVVCSSSVQSHNVRFVF